MEGLETRVPWREDPEFLTGDKGLGHGHALRH
jgi:hypothetical protein